MEEARTIAEECCDHDGGYVLCDYCQETERRIVRVLSERDERIACSAYQATLDRQAIKDLQAQLREREREIQENWQRLTGEADALRAELAEWKHHEGERCPQCHAVLDDRMATHLRAEVEESERVKSLEREVEQLRKALGHALYRNHENTDACSRCQSAQALLTHRPAPEKIFDT